LNQIDFFPFSDILTLTYCPPADTSGNANARVRQDVLRMTREELEDKFLRLNDENLNLKQHINKQDDKMKKLATKLMRLVKDRSRLEQLASGAAHQPGARVRDVEMEEMMEDLQDNVRSLQGENEALKQRLRVAKQQLIQQQSRRATPYSHIHPRVNSGLKKLRDSVCVIPPSVGTRSLDGAGRPPAGQLPRYGHSLLEDARAEIRNLENVIESQRGHMEALEGDAQLLREELRRREAEFEERLMDARQQQTTNLRSHVNSNVNMIKVQKQLAERSNAITELEGRFLQLQESQRRLKASHDTALSKVDSLSAALKEERVRSLELENQLRSSAVSNRALQQLQEQISELEQERDLLKENNNKLLNRAFDVSSQQRWQIQEQKLKLQISQLETALQADLVDKNEILDRVKVERDASEKLTEENKKLHIQFLEQKQQLEEMKEQLKVYGKGSDYDASELTEALLLVKKRKSERNGELGFLSAVGDEVNADSEVRKLRAAHAETIQELEKTRTLLSVESKLCKDHKAELDAVSAKLKSGRMELEQRLENQAKLLDSRASKIRKLEAQLKDIAYGTKAYVFRADVTEEDEADEFNESLHLERGENVLELQISSISLSPSALDSVSDPEPSTFCTYSVLLSELHSTPVVSGRCPRYGFTSRFVVRMDQDFLDYVNKGAVTVELHQALGLDWRTLAAGNIRLQSLMEQEGKVHGTIPLIGVSEEARSFGSLDYWLRLRIPMTETLLLYKEKVKAMDYVSSSLGQTLPQVTVDTYSIIRNDWNELYVTVHSCSGLRSRLAPCPSPYVVYHFYDAPDYPSETVPDSAEPHFDDTKLYSVLMDSGLHRYLTHESMQFYVFDLKEEQMDLFLGKANVPLKSLAQDKAITGVFELIDQSGLPAGHIQLSLKWKLSYLPPPGSEVTLEEPRFITKHRAAEEPEEPSPGLPQIQERPPLQRETRAEEETEAEGENSRAADAPQPNPAPAADEEEESHFSEGQILTACERIRLEVVSLSLRPESSVSRDVSVVRLFVEYSLLDLPSEETPVSLPKPAQGRCASYNYSKDYHFNNNQRKRHIGWVRFTVVSEPPEEEEQERDCEDVGVAFLSIPGILKNQRDLSEAPLNGQGFHLLHFAPLPKAFPSRFQS
uniref:RPGRIP1 like n=1 Tax=Neogobius melanostomus TaxID=47308 RepID=A0A8C6T9J8_9GOBI